MIPQFLLAATTLSASGFIAQSPAPRPNFNAFEVATIKPVEHEAKSSRYITMQGTSRFIEKDYTLKLLIAAAYNLSPKTISGGPAWIESDHYDIAAVTPGEVRPTHDEQMAMLRSLLADRFKLTFHREQKEFSIYELTVAKGGSKLKPSTAPPDDPPQVVSTVYPDRMTLPARNVTMSDLTSLMQRAMLDRPVVDKTGLTGEYDFSLSWDDNAGPDVSAALREQLGLRIDKVKVPVSTFVVDSAQKPTAN